MLLGMAALVNITMVGAVMSLAGHIPDSSFLVILSRYLRRRGEPEGAILYPAEAASRLERARSRVSQAAAALAAIGVGLTVWALAAGWGVVAMMAITAWAVAANLAFYHTPLSLWKRRAGKMREDDVEEAWRKAQPMEAGGTTEKDTPSTGEER